LGAPHAATRSENLSRPFSNEKSRSMHETTFLQDLAIVMSVAALATLIFRQLGQPVVLGYILAGVIIGPHTPPFALVEDEHAIETLAELGIIFLMFALGLEFSLRKLKEVGPTAFIAATLEILLMIFAGYALGRAFGWNQMDSIFLGAILSISSTTIIIKALEGLGKTRERFASLIFGILIVEDILAIVLIALLSGFATTGQLEAEAVGMTVLSLGSFLGILLVAGLIFVPRLLNYVARFKSDEMLLITVVGLCFGISIVTVKLGYSVALGAFIIGAIIAEARQIYKIETLMHPVRDLFSAVFFVSIGMLIDPALLLKYALPIVAITIVVVLGKVISCSLGSFVAGNDMRTSLRVGMGLAQIGEFSFIIAALGLNLNVTSDFIYPIAVAVSLVTTLLTPYLVKSSDGLVEWFDRVAPKPLLQAIDAYSERVGNLGQSGSHMERKLLGKLGGLIAVNLLIVTGIFIGAVFLHRRIVVWWPEFPGGEDGTKAATWFAALLVSFPILVAVWRKVEAGAMIVAETAVGLNKGGPGDPALQALISRTILVFGAAVLILIVALLSSALLPSWNVLVLTLLVMLVFSVFFYRGAVKLYSRAQSALRDTFAQPADPRPLAQETPSLPPLLREARLETVEVAPGTEAAGKMIAELKLRTRTGASVVGIERRGTSIVNPGPDEELDSGDQILLIGSEDQLNAARELLTGSKKED
jgi:CPA2 family monovalent cation:H+ antiporter-2